jgi:multidrug efflux pump
VRVQRGYVKPEDFASLAIARARDGHLVRIGEVARVELGSSRVAQRVPRQRPAAARHGRGEDLDRERAAGRRRRVKARDRAHPVTRCADRHAVRRSTRPSVRRHGTARGLQDARRRDRAGAGRDLLFLGSARAALIPAVTVPVCAVTAFAALYAFGFSINLLTLLALVLAIGLVVDDAIVVLENCQRRVDSASRAWLAAYRGARQVGFAVIATTAVLVAVFLPIAFMGGFSGRCSASSRVAIAAAVAISGVVALSLTPMMCSKMLVRTRTSAGSRAAWTAVPPHAGALLRARWIGCWSGRA